MLQRQIRLDWSKVRLCLESCESLQLQINRNAILKINFSFWQKKTETTKIMCSAEKNAMAKCINGHNVPKSAITMTKPWP